VACAGWVREKKKNVASGRGLEAKGEWEEEDDERRLGRTKTVGGPLLC
jgi:hypothetical protein